MSDQVLGQSPTDRDLLDRFAKSRDHAAYTQLVNRYMNLVYSSARRQVHDRHLAQDITQSVFLLLIQKAPHISPQASLVGWMLNATFLQSKNTLRQQRRRQYWERSAAAMTPTQQPTPPESIWPQIEPEIDQALRQLKSPDREALLLRYFQRQSYRQVAAALNVSETAVRQRVHRGLKILRAYFLRRGVTTSLAAIVIAIKTSAVQAAPVALTQSTLAAAASLSAKLAITSTSKGALFVMASTPTRIAIASAALAFFGIGAASFYYFSSPHEQVVALTPSLPADSSASQLPAAPVQFTSNSGGVQVILPTPNSAVLPTTEIRRLNQIVSSVSYDEKLGPKDGEGRLGWIETGHWARYNRVNLGPQRNTGLIFSALLSSHPDHLGAQIELHLDSVDGPILSTITVNSTGGLDTYRKQSAPLTWPGGQHDVYLRFTNGWFNLQSFQFELAPNNPATLALPATQPENGAGPEKPR